MSDQSYGLRFDIYERVHLSDEETGIEELEEIELFPRIQVMPGDDYATLRGHLLLTGLYRGEGERRELSHLIPVEITIPLSRVNRLEDISVEIENFDVDLLNERSLNVTGVLSLQGIETTAFAPAPQDWTSREYTASYVQGEGEEESAPWITSEAAFDTEKSAPDDRDEAVLFEQAEESKDEAGFESASENREQADLTGEWFDEVTDAAYVKERLGQDIGYQEESEFPQEADESFSAAGFSALAGESGEPLPAVPEEDDGRFGYETVSAFVSSAEPAALPVWKLDPPEAETGSADSAAEAVVAESEAAEPVAARPEAAEPEAVEPEAARPEAAEPVAAAAEAAEISGSAEEEQPAVLEAAFAEPPVAEAEILPAEGEKPQEPKIALNSQKKSEASGGEHFGFSQLLQTPRQLPASEEAKTKEERPAAEPLQAEPEDRQWKESFISKLNEASPFRKVRMVIVQREETIDEIADRYSVSARELLLHNRLSEQNIAEGQVLYLP
ncbi:LysM peptidoglycan-binding domain-containing protein [Paenibacillus caui]|uniref:LysM peptidoglycan-binding domain-containing protein n=1 Tax=Paenibacillus caui TaxID=2873927 RepID=UPI001F223303|nr:LysM peptidoglycan-binding domain-containing protein [Paenibacillus caui]